MWGSSWIPCWNIPMLFRNPARFVSLYCRSPQVTPNQHEILKKVRTCHRCLAIARILITLAELPTSSISLILPLTLWKGGQNR
ncbi:hypothetical protein B0T12DRAFT_141418 [Alternaria alternata]|nr:hypothetical protein B0T12DRAFT_141418 [Alternaria alternata]